MEPQILGGLQRIGDPMAAEINEILEKIGKGRKEVSVERVLTLLTKHSNWEDIKEDLKNYDYEK